MRHLYRSLCQVLTDKGQKVGGGRRQEWVEDEQMFDPYLNKVGHMMCRLDLSFMRPGKDEPTILQAGKAPDRFGVMFCDPTPALKTGHRLKCVYGPITGVFEIRAIDEVQDYSRIQHLEVSIVEVAQFVRNQVATNIPEPVREPHK